MKERAQVASEETVATSCELRVSNNRTVAPLRSRDDTVMVNNV